MRVPSWLSDLLDPLWPLSCPLCDTELHGPDVLRGGGAASPPTVHASCLATLPRVDPGPAWPRPVREGCPVRWGFADDPRFFTLLHAAKYRGRPDVVLPLARRIADLAAAWVPPRALLVPMPDDPDRLRERGVGITGLIAGELGRCLGRPVASGLLRRRAGLGSLAKVTGAAERARLVRHRFAVGRLAEVPRDVPLVLVEDQITTGSTATEAVRLLGSRNHSILLLALAAAAAAPRELHLDTRKRASVSSNEDCPRKLLQDKHLHGQAPDRRPTPGVQVP